MPRVYNVSVERRRHDFPVLDLTNAIRGSLPSRVDLRRGMPPVYDQGDLGSCTANALCGAFQYDEPSFMGSRLPRRPVSQTGRRPVPVLQ